MKTLAQIHRGVVITIREYPMAAEFAPTITMIDVTDLEVKPSEGWTYEDGVFATPVPVEPEVPLGIRKITKYAFTQRFSQTERISIRTSVDDIVIDISEQMKLASQIDLDLQATSDALDYLTFVSILESDRKAEMLVNGTDEESI